MTTTSNTNDESLRQEVKAWLAENWTQDVSKELLNEQIYWEVSAARKNWLKKVVEARWAVLLGGLSGAQELVEESR